MRGVTSSCSAGGAECIRRHCLCQRVTLHSTNVMINLTLSATITPDNQSISIHSTARQVGGHTCVVPRVAWAQRCKVELWVAVTQLLHWYKRIHTILLELIIRGTTAITTRARCHTATLRERATKILMILMFPWHLPQVMVTGVHPCRSNGPTILIPGEINGRIPSHNNALDHQRIWSNTRVTNDKRVDLWGNWDPPAKHLHLISHLDNNCKSIKNIINQWKDITSTCSDDLPYQPYFKASITPKIWFFWKGTDVHGDKLVF